MAAPTRPRRSSEEYIREPLQRWFAEFEAWGKRVRDDILALEDAVIDMSQGNKVDNLPFRRDPRVGPQDRKERYHQKYETGGDPGDPPGDPWR